MRARQFVAIGQAPTSDVPVATGPFRSLTKALDAVEELTGLGFNAYWVELQPLAEIDWSPNWAD